MCGQLMGDNETGYAFACGCEMLLSPLILDSDKLYRMRTILYFLQFALKIANRKKIEFDQEYTAIIS